MNTFSRRKISYAELKVVFFHEYGLFAAGENRPQALFLLGVVLIGALLPGIIFYRTEADFTNLYVYQKSRVQGELDLYNSRFGGFGRFQSIIISSSNGDIKSRKALKALLNLSTSALKRHEPELCLVQGDFVEPINTSYIKTLCGAVSEYGNSCLYCRCLEVSSNTQQITISAERYLDNRSMAAVNVHTTDICEKPPVPAAMEPSLMESIPPIDPRARPSQQWILEYNSAIAADGGFPITSGVEISTLSASLEACIVEYKVKREQGLLCRLCLMDRRILQLSFQ
jgi:hypothetical protein